MDYEDGADLHNFKNKLRLKEDTEAGEYRYFDNATLFETLLNNLF